MAPQMTDVRVNPSDETIRLGPLAVRFLITGEDARGSVAVFEFTVPGGTRPSQTVQRPSVSAADALTVTPVPADPTAMNRPSPGATTTAFMTRLLPY